MGLFQLGGTPGGAASSLTLTAKGTSPPMACAVYRAAANYFRGSQDTDTALRSLTLQAQCTSASGTPNTVSRNMTAARPPVVLVHGLWSGPDSWSNFNPYNGLTAWALTVKGYANYNRPVPGVTATTPSYFLTPAVNANALGFTYNAQGIIDKIQATISDFKNQTNAAAAQADVIAHSMGGDIARTIPTLSTFSTTGSYGANIVHKLITIGTPHIGSPVANDLLPSNGADPNACVRGTLV